MNKNDNNRFMSYLLSDLLHPVIIFLGAGSSQEGVREDGKPFPSFGQIQRGIIEKFGTQKQKERIKDAKKPIPFSLFLKVVEELAHEKKLSNVLRDFLLGKPGYAHFQLAATILATSNNLNFILTTNYDNLFVEAMRHLSSSKNLPFEAYPIQERQNRMVADLVRLARELPVLVKLFGDLGIHQGLFGLDDLNRVIYSNHETLSPSLSNPLLFIGYSFSDKLYPALLVESDSPVYIVNCSEVKPKTKRKCRQFRGTFGEFMLALLEKLEDEKPELHEKINEFLRQVDPKSKFQRIDEVKPLLHAMGKRSLGTVEGRFQIRSGERSNREFLIKRQAATTWVNGFLSSTYPLMLLLGESGLGKSCFLYETATQAPDHVIISFFAGSTLVGESSLFGMICQELSIAVDHVRSLFEHLDRLFTSDVSHRKWLIVIDGVNESPHFQKLMKQILDIAGWNLKHIKILYACRTVFWDNEQLANEQLERMHYSGWSCHIKNFTAEETEAAYRNYQVLLNISTPYAEIHPQVQKHMANPLMMRMIVQTYQGKRLLEYIPATTVFDNYWDHLCKKSRLKDSPLNTEVLKLLAKHKIDGFDRAGINAGDLFLLDEFLGDSKITEDAILAWQDEGVVVWIDVKRQSFRFAFDRFYEFVLSKILLLEHRKDGEPEIVSWILQKYHQFDVVQAHFSYQEALKSVLIRFGLEKRTLNLAGLVHMIPSLAYRSFVQQCLRELLFETDQPVIETFEEIITQVSGDEAEIFAEAQLTLAANSQKIIGSALKGLFSGEDLLAHRCIHLLLSLDTEHKDSVRHDARDFLSRVQELDEPHCKGLIYLYILYFCWNFRGIDPAESLSEASGNYLDLVIRFPDCETKLSESFADIIRRWGPHLFSTTSRGSENPFNYPWDRMDEPEREFALRAGQAIGKDFVDLTPDDFEAIRFFSMELPKVEQMSQPRPSGLPQKYPLESKLSQWVFIRHGKTHFQKIIQVLDGFMQTRDFCTSDFCICLLYDILTHHFQPSDPQYHQGYEQLKHWVDYFCEHDEGFFGVLQREDVYSNTYNPLEETAYIFSDLNPRAASNLFLDDWIKSGDLKRKKLGLLAVRRMWQKTGMQALNSVNCLFQSLDPEILTWLNRLMKEISLLDRRLYEQYLAELYLPASRLLEIENTASSLARTENYHPGALIKTFFAHGIGRIHLLQKWHQKIYLSASLDDFLSQLANRLVEEQIEEYLNQQSAFSDP